jgi:hypothetical protein
VKEDASGNYFGRSRFNNATVRLENALWLRRGGFVTNKGLDGVKCYCESTRIDVDDFDRVLVPDIYRFSVRIWDGSGNEMTAFGAYGNMDNRGPESPYPEPAIPFGWPVSVRSWDGRAFVADTVNRRIVVVRFDCAAEETCPVP